MNGSPSRASEGSLDLRMRHLSIPLLASLVLLTASCAHSTVPPQPEVDIAQCSTQLARAIAGVQEMAEARQRRSLDARAERIAAASAECHRLPTSAACSTAGILLVADADLNDTESYARALPFFEKGCKSGGGQLSCQAVAAIELLEERETGDAEATAQLAACTQHGQGCEPIAHMLPGRLRVHVTIEGCAAGNEAACDELRGWYGSDPSMYLPRERASIAQIVLAPCSDGRCAGALVAQADALADAGLTRRTGERASALYRQACELEPIYCSRLGTHLEIASFAHPPVEELVAGCEAGNCQGLAVFMRNPIPVDQLGGVFCDLHFVDACSAAFAVRACEEQGVASACWQSAEIYARGNSAITPDRDRALALHRRGCALGGAEACDAHAP